MLFYFSLFLVGAIAVQALKFQQHEYRLIHRKVVIDDYNRDFLENPVIKLFQYNETSTAFNSTVTVRKDLSENNLWAHMKVFKKTPTGSYEALPGTYILNICEAQRKDTFGTREIFLHSNLTECPVKAETYEVTNYSPDETKFPAFVPYGKLLVEGKVYEGDILLGSGHWFGTVEPLNSLQ